MVYKALSVCLLISVSRDNGSDVVESTGHMVLKLMNDFQFFSFHCNGSWFWSGYSHDSDLLLVNRETKGRVKVVYITRP
jgi:hypothetical protein